MEGRMEALSPNRPSLSDLPAELYLKILSFLDTARDVATLSQTCHKFLDLNNTSAWKQFCLFKFPTLVTPSTKQLPASLYWNGLANRLTRFSEGWERRAINALCISERDVQVLSQDCEIVRLGSGGKATPYGQADVKNTTTRKQTLNYRPKIASKAQYNPTAAGDGDSLVAWSTGADFIVRSASIHKNGTALQSQHKISIPCFKNGAQDVTTLHLLDCDEKDGIDLIVGRASSDLHRLSLDRASNRVTVKNCFHNSGPAQAVRAADVKTLANEQLLVAVSDHAISLWNATPIDYDVHPLSDKMLSQGNAQQVPYRGVWETRFLGTDKILVGLGQSEKPIGIFDIRPEGIIESARLEFYPPTNSRMGNTTSKFSTRSVFALEPITPLSRGGGSVEGQTFLSGWYDGFCRLYDLRASDTPVLTYHDVIDTDSAVYSLAAFGTEAFLAGTSNSILKFFDFRLGSKAYHYSDAQPCSPRMPYPERPGLVNSRELSAIFTHHRIGKCSSDASSRTLCHYHDFSRSDEYRPNMNVFLYGRSSPSDNRARRMRAPEVIPREPNPIYSLSIPSTEAPFIYAGTAGAVYQLHVDPKKSPMDNDMLLSMYETGVGVGETVSREESQMMPLLRKQRHVSSYGDARASLQDPIVKPRLSECWLSDGERRFATSPDCTEKEPFRW